MIRIMLVFHPNGELYFTTQAPQAFDDKHRFSDYGEPVMLLDVEETQIPPRGVIPTFRLVRAG